MRIVISQSGLTYRFELDGVLLASSAFNYLDTSSRSEVVGVGPVHSRATGVFWFYRFRVFIGERCAYLFRKNTWSKLVDAERRIELWKGQIIVEGSCVGEFRRSRESLVKPSFRLRLESRELLPLAVCYLPYAVGNRHV